MPVECAKILAKFSLGFNIEVLLVAEEDHTAGSDQAGKVVLLCIRKID